MDIEEQIKEKIENLTDLERIDLMARTLSMACTKQDIGFAFVMARQHEKGTEFSGGGNSDKLSEAIRAGLSEMTEEDVEEGMTHTGQLFGGDHE